MTHQETAQACWNSFQPYVRKNPAPWLWMYEHWRYLCGLIVSTRIFPTVPRRASIGRRARTKNKQPPRETVAASLLVAEIVDLGPRSTTSAAEFTVCSRPLAAQVCSLRSVRSLFGFARPAL